MERGVVSVCLGAAKGAFKTKREVPYFPGYKPHF